MKSEEEDGEAEGGSEHFGNKAAEPKDKKNKSEKS